MNNKEVTHEDSMAEERTMEEKKWAMERKVGRSLVWGGISIFIALDLTMFLGYRSIILLLPGIIGIFMVVKGQFYLEKYARKFQGPRREI